MATWFDSVTTHQDSVTTHCDWATRWPTQTLTRPTLQNSNQQPATIVVCNQLEKTVILQETLFFLKKKNQNSNTRHQNKPKEIN